jgi:putative ABC transport system permease protein
MTGAPPGWERLFRRLLPPEQRDAAIGDAAEELAARATRVGRDEARRWYRRQVLRSVPPAVARALRRSPSRGRPTERSTGVIDRWSTDFKVAFRTLVRQPMFTAIALVTLAVGIGANTALFSVYRAVFLDPIPLPEPDRLLFVMEQASFGCCGPASGPDYTDWVARERVFSGIGIISPSSVTLTGGGDAERVYATAASASLFNFLGVKPLLGRTFTTADEADPSAVILSYGLWQRRFGGRNDVIGATLEIDQSAYTIVGVMPESFDVPSPWSGTQHHQLYTPFKNAWFTGNRGSHSYPVVAQLRPGATLGMAQDDMNRIMRELGKEYPQTNANRSVKVFTAHDYMFGDIGRELALILGAAGLVLLIACGNIAGLQLARATAREAELAVRSALGATRGALVRLLLAESLLVAAFGGLAGMVVSLLAVEGLRAILPATIPRVDQVHVNGTTLMFTLGVTAVTALAFGVLPSVSASRRRPAGGLGTRGSGDLTPRKERLRDAFIVVQIALGLVLANGAALLVRSYALVRSEAPGFRADGVLTMTVRPSGDRYKKPDAVRTYYQDLLARVRAVPGVESVGTISRLPLSGGSNGNVLIEGRPPRSNEGQGPLVEVTSTSGDYFAAMGITLLRGRGLRPEDDADGVLNVVVNRHFAREGWPDGDALGKRFSFSDNPPQWATVVGIVDDIRQWGAEQPPISQAYYTLSNGWTTGGYLVVRTTGDPTVLAQPVRKALLAVDSTQPTSDIQTMMSRVDRAFVQRRFYTVLIGLFAMAALLLAGAGVYGTVSYYVARRQRELGIRAALGASGAGIVGLVVWRGARLAALGVAIGLLGVWGSTSLLAKLLYGTAPLDGWTMTGGSTALAAVAVVASALPARRAARIPPVVALRME